MIHEHICNTSPANFVLAKNNYEKHVALYKVIDDSLLDVDHLW